MSLWTVLGKTATSLICPYMLCYGHLSIGSLSIGWHLSACSLKSYVMLTQKLLTSSACSLGSCWYLLTSLQYNLTNDFKLTKARWNANFSCYYIQKNLYVALGIFTDPPNNISYTRKCILYWKINRICLINCLILRLHLI